MRLVAVIVALLLDHFYATAWRERVRVSVTDHIQRLKHVLVRAGLPLQLGWLSVCAIAALSIGVLQALLAWQFGVAAWLLFVACAYVAVDWSASLLRLKRVFWALQRGDLPLAREHAQFAAEDAAAAAPAVVERALQQAMAAALMSGFSPLFWSLLLGAPGLVAYWVCARLAHSAARPDAWARRALNWLDWLPSRAAALSFAVVGDFEATLLSWRTQALVDPSALPVIVAAGVGAIGARVTTPAGEIGLGEPPGIEQLQSAEALLWRSLVLWLIFAAIVGAVAWAIAR